MLASLAAGMSNNGKTPRERGPTESSSASFAPLTSSGTSAARSIDVVLGPPSSSPRSQPAEFHDRSSPLSAHRSTSPASTGSGSFHSDTPSRSSTTSSRFPFAWAAGAGGNGALGGGIGIVNTNPNHPRGLTSDPSTYTSPTSASASSTGTSTTTSAGTANPSAPVTVNTPLPVMHLPSALSGVSRRSQAPPASRTVQVIGSQPPDPSAFNFSTLLDDLLRDPNAAKDLDAMAEICGRSKLSRANEYAAHRDPIGTAVGSGNIGTSEGVDVAGSTGAIRIAGSDHGSHGDGAHHADDGDGSLHPALMTHFAPFTHSSGAALDTVDEAASEHSRATSYHEERRRSALDIFSGSSNRRRGSPGRGSPSVATAEGTGTGVLVPTSVMDGLGAEQDRAGQGRQARRDSASLSARRREAEGRLRWLAGA